jgi:hypothetical protein
MRKLLGLRGSTSQAVVVLVTVFVVGGGITVTFGGGPAAPTNGTDDPKSVQVGVSVEQAPTNTTQSPRPTDPQQTTSSQRSAPTKQSIGASAQTVTPTPTPVPTTTVTPTPTPTPTKTPVPDLVSHGESTAKAHQSTRQSGSTRKQSQRESSTSTQEPVYWQVDFGAGGTPPLPPYYGENDRDVVAALGNSDDGVTENPSVYHTSRTGQLANVSITDYEFHFDDSNHPTEVTITYELASDAQARTLHLAVFTMPGQFDYEEIDQQRLHAVTNETVQSGETGSMTLDLPQP